MAMALSCSASFSEAGFELLRVGGVEGRDIQLKEKNLESGDELGRKPIFVSKRQLKIFK